jgi:hypothetical protein
MIYKRLPEESGGIVALDKDGIMRCHLTQLV